MEIVEPDRIHMKRGESMKVAVGDVLDIDMSLSGRIKVGSLRDRRHVQLAVRRRDLPFIDAEERGA